ncbi:MAG: cupin domain-containing protein [Verrucomicrobiae bacterium]|nr:cupin domain-containing protein [Verrucomicrobiae bacterium]
MSEPVFKSDAHAVLDLRTETQYAANGIVSRTLFQGATGRVILFGFDKGQELSEHTSPYRAFVQILEGECEFLLGATWHKLKAGDLAHMTPGLPHAIRAVERFSMLLTLFPEKTT